MPREVNTVYECIEREDFGYEQVEQNGRIVRRTKLVKVNQVEKMRDYKVSDFYLENLIASGYDLKSAIPLDVNRFRAIDAAESVANSINKLKNEKQ